MFSIVFLIRHCRPTFEILHHRMCEPSLDVLVVIPTMTLDQDGWDERLTTEKSSQRALRARMVATSFAIYPPQGPVLIQGEEYLCGPPLARPGWSPMGLEKGRHVVFWFGTLLTRYRS